MNNQNANITKEIKSALGLSELTGYPSKVADAIIPVVPVNKKSCNIVRHTEAIAPTTLYTTPTNADFYLCSAWISVGNVDSGGINRSLSVVIDGQTQILLEVDIPNAAAAGSGSGSSLSINPAYPIKLDRGSAVISSGSLATTGHIGIIGYTEEVTGD